MPETVPTVSAPDPARTEYYSAPIPPYPNLSELVSKVTCADCAGRPLIALNAPTPYVAFEHDATCPAWRRAARARRTERRRLRAAGKDRKAARKRGRR